MKIESYLPIFPGFYETLFEADETDYIEDGHTWDDYSFDYEEYRRRVAVACVGFIERELKDFGIKIKFQSVVSPREYNFANDSINVEYSIKSLKPIRDYIKTQHREAFQKFLIDNCTKRDGFIPWHSTDVDDWVKNISNTHKFGQILEFILINESEGYEGQCNNPQRKVEYEMYDDVVSEMRLDATLKETT